MVVDTWSNVNKIHVEGVLITLGPRSFMLRSVLAGTEHHAIAFPVGGRSILWNPTRISIHFVTSVLIQPGNVPKLDASWHFAIHL